MNATKILSDEIDDLKVSSLPTRPTAPKAFGGKGYSSFAMKKAFDNLPLLIIERLNMLIGDITSTAFSSDVKLSSSYTLKNLYDDLRSGTFADVMKVSGQTLAACIEELKAELTELRSSVDSLAGKE